MRVMEIHQTLWWVGCRGQSGTVREYVHHPPVRSPVHPPCEWVSRVDEWAPLDGLCSHGPFIKEDDLKYTKICVKSHGGQYRERHTSCWACGRLLGRGELWSQTSKSERPERKVERDSPSRACNIPGSRGILRSTALRTDALWSSQSKALLEAPEKEQLLSLQKA